MKKLILSILFILCLSFQASAWNPMVVVSGSGGLGPELHVSANAASDPNGNEADATTGWTDEGASAIIASIADPFVGTYALEVTAGDTSSERMELSLTVENGASYRVSFNAKRGAQGNQQKVLSWAGVVSSPSDTIDSTSYAPFSYDVTTNATTIIIRIYACDNGSIGDSVIADNVSVRKIL